MEYGIGLAQVATKVSVMLQPSKKAHSRDA